jgi:hypothetical protein
MRLLPTQILTIWEQGISQLSTQRAMIILSTAMPTVNPQDLEELSLGNRNLKLLNIREALFGTKIDCLAHCHHCQEFLEFNLDSTLLKSETPPSSHEFVCTIEETKYKLRLINCQDLAIAAQQPNVAEAERVLIERCILSIDDQEVVAPQSPPKAVHEKLAVVLQRHDPLAELLIHLTCPICNKNFQTALEIADFLWNEIATYAKQLLSEVHLLAQTYGWNEETIFALSRARRQYYLQQISQ